MDEPSFQGLRFENGQRAFSCLALRQSMGWTLKHTISSTDQTPELEVFDYNIVGVGLPARPSLEELRRELDGHLRQGWWQVRR